MKKRIAAFAVCLACLVILGPAAVTLPGRDQAAYALGGKAILEGGGPYRDVFDVHDPGVQLFNVIGSSFKTWKWETPGVLTLAWQLLTALMLFLFCEERLKSRLAGIIAAVVYSVSITSLGFEGQGQPETFVALPLVLALFAWTRENRSRGSRFAGGLCVGAATLFSLNAFWAFAGYVVYRAVLKRAEKEAGRVRYGTYELLGFLAVIGACAALATAEGWLVPYFKLRFVFAPAYESSLRGGHTIFRHLLDMARGLARPVEPPVVAAGLALAAVGAWRRWIDRGPAALLIATTISLVFSFALRTVALPHQGALYWGAGMPLLGYAVSGATGRLKQRFGSRMSGGAVSALVVVAVIAASPVSSAITKMNDLGAWLAGEDIVTFNGRFADAGSGFDAAEVRKAAAWIEANTAASDGIVVYGNEPGLFLFSGRRAACGLTNILPVAAIRPAGAEKPWLECVSAEQPKAIAVIEDARTWTRGYEIQGAHRTTVDPWTRKILKEDYVLKKKAGAIDLYLRK